MLCLRSLQWLGLLAFLIQCIVFVAIRKNLLGATEDTHTGKKSLGTSVYRVKSNLLAYFRLGSKYITASLTLYSLVKFIAEHGIPRMLITDCDGILGSRNK